MKYVKIKEDIGNSWTHWILTCKKHGVKRDVILKAKDDKKLPNSCYALNLLNGKRFTGNNNNDSDGWDSSDFDDVDELAIMLIKKKEKLKNEAKRKRKHSK